MGIKDIPMKENKIDKENNQKGFLLAKFEDFLTWARTLVLYGL